MGKASRIVISSILGFIAIPTLAEAQKRHPVRLEADPTKDSYRFSPASITARPGDVLIFKVGRGAPHSIVFEAEDLNEATHEAINGAMGRRTGDLSSPLLTAEGTEYRMVVPRIVPGVYRFYCLPHRAYDMRGELRVTK
jgi:plastocyanin